MELNEAEKVLNDAGFLMESVTESTITKNVIDEEYDNLERIIKKEFKRGHMSDQEYDFLNNRLDLLLDIIYKFTENKW